MSLQVHNEREVCLKQLIARAGGTAPMFSVDAKGTVVDDELYKEAELLIQAKRPCAAKAEKLSCPAESRRLRCCLALPCIGVRRTPAPITAAFRSRSPGLVAGARHTAAREELSADAAHQSACAYPPNGQRPASIVRVERRGGC